ncbi:NAD(P)H-hydrate dehydratase [Paracoccus hibiscisoli]|uniref:Bifunctional NAD(P)H-hydrate repair enzyme n=1 Tax=Paracoccus hibiscisoli TaxID=2023261 RepID=A0A4V5MTX0_9RHOB|nr:NAD(P)H-hydrate dehydratase [Paracoccus hibiscisoli]TJZ85898.1 NAD(P)H-hydrate dehydratase [Paracoccus hibiscisoli]
MIEGPEIVTCAQMRAMESAAMGSGAISGLNLMTRAGRAVAGQIRLRWPVAGRATVLCGPGNNGGDGYVVAQALAQAGWSVRVLGGPPRPGSDAAAARARWQGDVHPLTVVALRAGPAPDLYVDAILGTGLTRPPEGEVAALLAHLAQADIPVVAVDGPSGLCLDSGQILGLPRGAPARDALRAALTVTFDSPRPGHLLEHGPAACGTLIVADIGLEPFRVLGPTLPRLTALWPRPAIPNRRPLAGHGPWLRKQQSAGGHKYDHGAALIVTGGPGAGGAARLAARAALRAGAGLVTLAPPQAAMAEHALPPDALMRRAIDDGPALAKALADRRAMALCLGPGGGVARMLALLPPACAAARPMVLDADALTALAQAPHPLPPSCVLTPHGGEFARLFPDLAQDLARPGGPGKVAVLRIAAQRIGAVVLLKGPDTVIAAPDGRAAIHSDAAIPWLATAGAGDVLAGLITGLLARGLPPFAATCLAVRLHGQAARQHGPGLIADDLVEALPAVIAAWR